jgi:hypothetical protein
MCLLHAINDNEMVKKKKLDFAKIKFIWMEILIDIACRLNCIQMLELNSNILNQI